MLVRDLPPSSCSFHYNLLPPLSCKASPTEMEPWVSVSTEFIEKLLNVSTALKSPRGLESPPQPLSMASVTNPGSSDSANVVS